ncbi:tyrosine-protein phosphatase [Pseudonocardia kujensis]|uniref:tyrosine-protein phosphatase n=1 Tax=Pseudonocardia kujensis TaxID=1128675 RepID=UPI001E5EC59A|nr:tyrosine-protein phosphatase [Pseudonocardia kujensis]MCE0766300.1 tyrosine-protein phosphatase [Pseudonocardia kujensis]
MSTSLPPDLRTPANLRDVGGLPTIDGRRVRAGVYLRSDAPQPGDRTPLVPGTVIDLRSRVETRGLAHPLAGVSDVHEVPLGVSLAPDLVAATPTADRDLAWAYRLLVTEATAELARIIRIVARSRGPVLVHCAAGKDRTGIVTAVVLGVVGVPREHVLADYLRTNENLERLWARLEAGGVPLPGDVQGLFGVDRAALEAVLDAMEARPGGLRGHLLAHGTDPDDLDLLTRRLVG